MEMKATPVPHTRLLIVDDEQGFVDVLTNRLDRRGIDVVKTYSGAQALQALRRNIFDVMVLDLKMEDMDGIEVLKIVRKMAPELPVIILTGHGSRTAAEDGMTSGVFDYLTKPCELNDLMEKISLARQTKNKQNGETDQ